MKICVHKKTIFYLCTFQPTMRSIKALKKNKLFTYVLMSKKTNTKKSNRNKSYFLMYFCLKNKTKNKIMYIILVFILFALSSCSSQKPITTTHAEHIEERLQPVAIGADTIEITEYRSQSTNIPCSLLPAPCSLFPAPCSLLPAPCSLFHVPYSLLPAPCSLKSTRPINIQRTETDTTSTLRITLRPDTVYLPYTHHIRSDTIIITDRICKTKLQKTQTANTLLILILIIVIIFFISHRLHRLH